MKDLKKDEKTLSPKEIERLKKLLKLKGKAEKQRELFKRGRSKK